MKKQILIVDDARLMRQIIISSISNSSNYDIHEAKNGHDAVALYQSFRPDLVTMDITMEKMNGVEAAKEIFRINPAAKIIMITSLGQEKLLSECIEAGVSDFIVKPFTRARVSAAVFNALKGVPIEMSIK